MKKAGAPAKTRRGRGGARAPAKAKRTPARKSASARAKPTPNGLEIDQLLAELETLRSAQVDIEHSQHLYAELYDHAPIAYVNLNDRGTILSANLAAADLMGHAARRLTNFPFRLFVHRDDHASLSEHIARCRKSDGETVATEVRLVLREREPRHVELVSRGTSAFGTTDRIFRTVVRDMTQQRRAEAALRHSEETLRLVLENARDYAIIVTDLLGRVRVWNAGAQNLIGYSAEEMIGRSIDITFAKQEHAEGLPARQVSSALESGAAADERWYVRKDGSQFWGSGIVSTMRDAKNLPIGFVWISRDATAARDATEALANASRAKDKFLAVLSHELRTPLTPVVMAVQALGLRDDLPETAESLLDIIRRNVKLESHLIDDLLDLTRITRGKLEISNEPMSVHAAVEQAIEVCTSDIDSRRQRLEVGLAATIDNIKGDAPRLQQVFWNLLKNASKFTPEGGEIIVSSRNKDGRLLVSVTDTGMGIEPEELPLIFDAFSQGNDQIARRFGGLGLGLAISKATVEAHGGRLHAESSGAAKGATFSVELPLLV